MPLASILTRVGALALTVAATLSVAAEQPTDELLSTLRPQHPRLQLTAERLAAVKKCIADDQVAARVYAAVRKEADRAFKKKPCKYEKPDGRRLLSVSREVLERVSNWSFVYRLSGERKYADRAWSELTAAANFPDWNPAHFLDTAEMTRAFAVGYDWLYDCWSIQQRAVLRRAIVEKGLGPALKCYEPKPRSWAVVSNNWNQVCNGGIALGALAIADEEPRMAAKIIRAAVAQIPRAVRVYLPDGAGTEGVTYWSYATRYNTALLDALETALGSCLGLDRVDGYAQSGDFQLYFSGADGRSFNFGDCGETRLSTAQHFWFGKHYAAARHSWFRYQALRDKPERGEVADLLWFDASAKDLDPRTFPLDKHFRRAEVAVMRSAWNDPHALVLGIEGAPPDDYSHRHLDSGSFIFEAQGVRWVVDCGTEHETYLTHQHHLGRWEFYRTRAEGHNTLVLNPDRGPDQVANTPAPMTRFESRPDGCVAVMDLSRAYQPHAQRVTRTYSLVDRKRVLLHDEIQGAQSADVWWFLHTQAQIQLAADRRSAAFTQDGRRLMVAIRDPPGAGFEIMEAKPLPGSPNPAKQAGNAKIRKLAIHLRQVTDVKLAVELLPGG